ncbi:alpha/beta fold hydrolase [Bacillus thuringiensis]|uniref:alpha/beta fold hydrolase n=1 Tax=Bacillus thuringiensis TaxID=1428 RepID=UPI001F62421F|nr:alpha/beta hydrolase [Bacillus thuringiensis]
MLIRLDVEAQEFIDTTNRIKYDLYNSQFSSLTEEELTTLLSLSRESMTIWRGKMDTTITLPDDRRLAYCTYGKVEGYPVFIFHGTPGSRIWGLEEDEVVQQSNLYLIATDRPGFGGSTSQKNRTLLDFAEDIYILAKQLGYQKYAVLGVSGGGAYAAACAARYPNEVSSLHLISSATPFINGKAPKEMSTQNKLAFFMACKLPFVLRMSYQAQKKTLVTNRTKFYDQLKKSSKYLNEWDRQYLQTQEQFEGFAKHLEAALKQNVEECINEPKLLTKPWEFNLANIQAPTFIWHGAEDKMSPASSIHDVAKQIPNAQLHIVPQAGHFLTEDTSIWQNILSEIVVPN